MLNYQRVVECFDVNDPSKGNTCLLLHTPISFISLSSTIPSYNQRWQWKIHHDFLINGYNLYLVQGFLTVMFDDSGYLVLVHTLDPKVLGMCFFFGTGAQWGILDLGNPATHTPPGSIPVSPWSPFAASHCDSMYIYIYISTGQIGIVTCHCLVFLGMCTTLLKPNSQTRYSTIF